MILYHLKMLTLQSLLITLGLAVVVVAPDAEPPVEDLIMVPADGVR
jgi:hypothetical protein